MRRPSFISAMKRGTARVAVAPVQQTRGGKRGHPRFAIRPYPKEWEKVIVLQDGARVLLRPVRPDDEPLYREFFPLVTAEDLRLRFFGTVKDFSHGVIARLTQLDYARSMAFLAVEEAKGDMLGVVCLHANADYDRGEFAILVRSDLKGHGLGWILMEHIIDYARAEGIEFIEGQVLPENLTMLTMCRHLGFVTAQDPNDSKLMLVKLQLPRGSLSNQTSRSDR